MNILKSPNKMKFVSLVLSLIGLWLMLNSPELGSRFASSWVRSMGGSVDSQEYLQMLKEYISTYKTLGGIFLFVGLFSFLNDHHQ
ncbi:hypothetical protein FP515_04690 [Geobacillus thermoleovorans]|uniref:Uncharacterized protein n=1 Tax=Bacillus caldolyticus TaxID=1394 RepID=A0ABM6QLC1_BACCL|nr:MULTISPECIES: hypothetical protein [Geobacillus]ALA71081.1 hypothetical protein GT50_13620 [Geobacillus stearothermophilus 10]ADI27702.1 hypothetical protein GC56T3_2754 [Geobacillus sp. C56-T3]ADU93199.1 hypothetical protein GYMC52_0715 [Geobacillus sp. Y412MC52]AUI36189.1 hypothetical protein CWI35_06250 [[Bacillus] caldolyticus]PJW18373.1 hypothetical protein CV944_03465 [Geobacillus sp. WSUCF-018B]